MWLILSLNFACFVVITACYTVINIITRRSSERSGATQNPSIIRQNKTLQKRIAAIIATDFVCWVPICIICALHNHKVIDATDWYVNFTMAVLPINSVINPLLYDNTMRVFFVRKFQGMLTMISNSSIAVYIRQTWQDREDRRIGENIEMEDVQAPASRSPRYVAEPT